MYNQEWEIKPRAILCRTCQRPFNNGQVYVSSLKVAAEGYERVDCCEDCWKKAAGTSAAPGQDSPPEPASEKPAVAPPAELAPRSAIVLPPSRSPLRWAKEGRDGESAKPGSAKQRDAPNEAAALLPKAGEAFSVWKGTFQAELPPPEVLKKETAESLLRKLIEKNDPHFRNAIFILAVMLERKRLLAEREVRKSEDEATIRVYEHRQTGETFIITDPMLNLNQLGQIQEELATFLSGQAMPAAASPSQSEAPKQNGTPAM